jgi:polysaccharide export outer membrane protein
MALLKNLCFASAVMASVAGCDIVLRSPKVTEGVDKTAHVRVRAITAETVHQANLAAYTPRSLPAAFSITSGASARVASVPDLPQAPALPETRPERLTLILPPPAPTEPYRIGISDVVLLSTPQVGGTVEELTGLLAAQNARQGYTVQNGGSINVPNVGRIQIGGLTISEAEDLVFQKLLENQIDPAFSLEIAEFNSQKVSVGGAVAEPTIVPITFTPLYLDEVLAAAGGITVEALDYATVRLFRNGELYQIPLQKLYSNTGLSQIKLIDGDAIFVDAEYDLRQAESFFQQAIQRTTTEQALIQAELGKLSTQISLRRAELSEQRENFSARHEFGAEKRDFAYVTGEVREQTRFALPYETTASLTDALFDEAGGIVFNSGDVSEIYVLRASSDPREFGVITAWNLDARNVAVMTLAALFELRPNDIVFVASQPITRWNRVISQLLPTLSVVNSGASLADR